MVANHGPFPRNVHEMRSRRSLRPRVRLRKVGYNGADNIFTGCRHFCMLQPKFCSCDDLVWHRSLRIVLVFYLTRDHPCLKTTWTKTLPFPFRCLWTSHWGPPFFQDQFCLIFKTVIKEGFHCTLKCENATVWMAWRHVCIRKMATGAKPLPIELG